MKIFQLIIRKEVIKLRYVIIGKKINAIKVESNVCLHME